MTKSPSVQLPALFVRLPLPTHELLRQLADAADESLSRYVIALIESRRPGGARLPSRRPRARERVAIVAPVVEVAPLEQPPKRKRGRPRKVVVPQLPVEGAVAAAPVEELVAAPRRPRGRPRKVPLGEVVIATPPRKRHARVPLETTPAVDAAPVEEPLEQPVIAAPPSSRTDTLDRIRAALASLDAQPLVDAPADESTSRVVVEDAP